MDQERYRQEDERRKDQPTSFSVRLVREEEEQDQSSGEERRIDREPIRNVVMKP